MQVGGLTQEQAAERLMQMYTAVPVEVHYRDAVIQIRPTVIGFELDVPAMMTAFGDPSTGDSGPQRFSLRNIDFAQGGGLQTGDHGSTALTMTLRDVG